MHPLHEYRQQLAATLEQTTRDFRNAVEAVADSQPALSTVEGSALQAGGWSAHQIAAHTRDTHTLVYGPRIRRAVDEDNPLFVNFDGEKWMAEHYNADEPLASILDELTDSVRATVSTLKGLSPEGWARESQHETLGAGFAVQTWAERTLAHIEEHLVSVRGK